MPVPGMKTKFEIRAKVRIGEKKTSAKGNSYPSSVDYFLSTDPELAELFGPSPSTIQIRFPYASVADAFSTGLEWWTKTQKRENLLACYSKDEGDPPIALRYEHFLKPEDEIRGEKVGQGRIPITCPNRECPILQKGDCKPMGRLIFYLDGGRDDKMLELDTKSWNSIERVEPVLARSDDLRRHPWALSVAYETRGANRFPVLSIEEVAVEVNNDSDVTRADAFVAVEKAVADCLEPRVALARGLNVFKPGWKNDPEYVAKMKMTIDSKGVEYVLEQFKARMTA